MNDTQCEPKGSDDSSPRCDCVITLVHGTWGRGFFPRERADSPRWFEKGSAFCSGLIAELQRCRIGCRIEALTWSGANSILERNEAAKKLVELLNDQRRTSSSAIQVVIGHSHGGNIALRSLHLIENPDVRPIIVTIATPFIRLIKECGQYLLWPPFVMAIPFAVNLGLIAILLSILVSNAFSTLGIILTYLAILTVSIFLWLFWPGLTRLLVDKDKTTNLMDASFYDLGEKAPPHMLALRGVDDEASITLTLGGLGIRLSALVCSSAAISLISNALKWTATIALVAWYFFEAQSRYIYTIISITIFLGVSYLLALVFAQICRTVFGRELLTGSVGCEVAANSSPDCTNNIQIITLPPNAGYSLRHGLYTHPLCVKKIAEWLTKHTVQIS